MSLRQFTPPHSLPPFTHKPGTMAYLPGSPHVIQVFPTALRLYGWHFDETELVQELTFPDVGPLSGWTASFDSMRHIVVLEGSAKQGFVRFCIDSSPDGISFRSRKGPVKVVTRDETVCLQQGEKFPLVQTPCTPPQFPTPRLLLGWNKAQNWDRICTTAAMEEVLPLWYQLSPARSETAIEPSSTLIGQIIEAIQKQDSHAVLSAFATFFRVAIHDFFVPKRKDDLFLGYSNPLLPDDMSIVQVHPLICCLIRSMFLQEEGNIVTILPCLPKEFIAGRLLHETLTSGHHIDLEWRKGCIRRILVHATRDDTLTLRSSAASGSIRELHGKRRKSIFKVGDPIEIHKDEQYLLDNFLT